MKVGLELGEFVWDGGPAAMGRTVAEIATVADDAGYDLIGVGDHVWQGPHAGGPGMPQLECFTTLGVIAAHTRRCRLAPVVAGVHFRAPALLAKTVTTLDVLSGGRAVLGIGTGWDADEAAGMGIDFPPTAQRFAMLEEALQICLRLWHGDERPFDGEHYRLARPLAEPKSLSRPHPPIMLGGGGRKTLRLVARYGDACNVYPGPDLAEKLDLLRELCDQEGRDYDAIEKTCIFPFTVAEDGAGASELTDELHRLSAAGIDTAIGIVSGSDPVRQVSVIGDKVIPAVTG
ncbi:LLM class F420-dependent oxidoreductase [Actinokineospora fastidiosa]|uniref:LLM class F420-dependent oxidoreductase n=1 Tax=Actinokineospora fastidiosa TaxID=1816 RepID=A0A918GTT6_9PSEU|nr:LLM class F420-dependent oxidoreductase [Actinokineospora fastidiosa]GGS57888.1 LLM class F420-dependent oxidoreductase [Actinokineospora fastidiosa]